MFALVYLCYLCLHCVLVHVYVSLPRFHSCLPMFTTVYSRTFTYAYPFLLEFILVHLYTRVYSDYSCWLCLLECVLLFATADSCLPMFTTVYPCLFYYDYPSLLVFIYVYSCLHMFAPAYSCYLCLSLFSHACLPMLTRVYHVYHCLHGITLLIISQMWPNCMT